MDSVEESEDKFDEFHYHLEVVDEAVQEIRDNQTSATPADVGLALAVLSDMVCDEGAYTPDDDVCIRVLNIASEILNMKHTTPELPWFDIHQSLLASRLFTTSENNLSGTYEAVDRYGEVASIPDALRSVKQSNGAESSHTRQFHDALDTFADVASTEAFELLREMRIDDTQTQGEWLRQSLRTKVGFEYGAVEIPNNISRMEVVRLNPLVSDLTDDELSYVHSQLRDWLESYARAEAMAATEALNHSDLREYMLEKETPAERYF